MDLPKILVTGGAGFIGHHLVKRLLSEKYRVRVVDNFSSGKVQNIAPYLKLKNFELIKGDVRNRNTVREYLNGIDAVVHLAAMVSVEKSMKDPSETYNVNFIGTVNLVDEAVRKGVKRFIYASSAAVYGDNENLPLKEVHPYMPLSPYAGSKVSAECYCRDMCAFRGLDGIILRYFNVYGSGQDYSNPYGGVITRFVRNCANDKCLTIFGEGDQTRDFIHVEDVVESTVLALKNHEVSGETLNVCTGEPVKIIDLAEKVRAVSGKKDVEIVYDEPRIGEVKHSYGDPKRAEEVLDFKAKVELDKGIRELVR